MYRCLLCGTREVLKVIGGVSHRSKHRKANSIIYAVFQEVGPDNSSEESGEQTMVKVRRSPWSEVSGQKEILQNHL